MTAPSKLPAGPWTSLLPQALTVIDEIRQHSGVTDPFFTYSAFGRTRFWVPNILIGGMDSRVRVGTAFLRPIYEVFCTALKAFQRFAAAS